MIERSFTDKVIMIINQLLESPKVKIFKEKMERYMEEKRGRRHLIKDKKIQFIYN